MADQQITLAELLPQMEACALKMGKKNPTRRVLWIAAHPGTWRKEQILSVRAESDSRGAID